MEEDRLLLFQGIYDQTFERVHRYVLVRCTNATDVADLLQNIYLQFYRRLSLNQNIEFPERYLLRMAKHELIKHYGLWRQRSLQSSLPISPIQEGEFQNYDLSFLFEDASNDRLLCDAIWRYLHDQDFLTYQIFVLYFCHDLKLTEIAKELNISESTVKNRLYRQLKVLRERFLS